MERLRENLSKICIVKGGDKVYKDECIYSFDNPETSSGLYICLKTFLAVGKNYLEHFCRQTGNNVFLHVHHTKKEIAQEAEPEPDKKIARLAIGMEGGFNPDCGAKKYTIEKVYGIVVMPDHSSLPFPSDDLPQIVTESVNSILKADSAMHLAEVEAAALAWDGEVRVASKHSESLLQLDTGVKIPSSGWQCSECDKNENLWLNLTDGVILCGRKQLDGSGGNNHALVHYEKTKYPLAVKLGTITPDGKADIYSYDEDDMVLDSNLIKHLAHFGINISQMEKTEKTMLELEIAYNQRAWEWSRLTESGKKLRPKFGAGYTGMKNLGNSCYVNSVMQVLLTIPTFVERYYSNSRAIRETVPATQVPGDYNAQFAKLSEGLLSGSYSAKPAHFVEESDVDLDEVQPGISPVMFRTLVGKGHAEFSTKKQQDAMEFLEHILKLSSRNSVGSPDPGNCFKFEVEDRFVCSVSKKVRYVKREELSLPFPVPIEAAVNRDKVLEYIKRKEEARAKNEVLKPEDEVHYEIPFENCLSNLRNTSEAIVLSSAVGRNVPMELTSRLVTFPDYLIIHLVKFGLSSTWQPEKLDVSIKMPDILDLSSLRVGPRDENEEILPESNSPCQSEPDVPSASDPAVLQLAEMGFPIEECRKAVYYNANAGPEAALNWIMEHMDDPNFGSPLVINPKSKDDTFVANEEGLAMLMSMGFTTEQSKLALRETSNNLERAADWIFSHQTELDSMLSREAGGSHVEAAAQKCTDGEPRYELVGFISHMGQSIYVGHYVCHIKKNGEWSIFNDNKVCKSESTPTDLGYIYLYKRL